jgi:hypothetical protein
MAIKLPWRNDRPGVDPQNPFDRLDACKGQNRRHTRLRRLHTNLDRMQPRSPKALHEALRALMEYLFYKSSMRQSIAKNPPALDFDEHRAMAKSAPQESQLSNFGRIPKDHDRALAAGLRSAISVETVQTRVIYAHFFRTIQTIEQTIN